MSFLLFLLKVEDSLCEPSTMVVNMGWGNCETCLPFYGSLELSGVFF